MDQNTINQAINLIDKSRNILLLTHAKADCDGLGAVLATYLVLKELGKDVTTVTNDPTPENLAFLPSISIIQNSLASAKDFVISLDTTRTPLSKIKYNLEGNRINIIVTPKSGAFSKEDVTFSQGTNKFDLIISMDAGNLEHLGPIYDQNAELFFETPLINIDHHASNTDFGQVNMVDVVASSATEVLYHVLKEMEKKYDKKLITEDVATLLLAGIITDTGSFQHANTSPKSMEVSAKLLDMGARQQEIIKNIYKTKKLSTLKLWGIVLSKVQVDPMHRMVWSTISKDDIQEADANPDESEGIIDDLLSNAPGAEVIMLIKENKKEGYISVSMRSTTNSVDVGKIAAEMGGGGHTRAAGYKVRDGKPFDQVVSEILTKVRKYQADRLNIHPETAETRRDAFKVETSHGASQGEGVPPRQRHDSATTAPRVEDTAPPQESKPKKVTYLEFKEPGDKQTDNKPAQKPVNKPQQEKKQPQKISQQKGNKPGIKNKNIAKGDPPMAEKPQPKVQPQNITKPEEKKPVEPKPEPPAQKPENLKPEPPLDKPVPEVPDWLKEK